MIVTDFLVEYFQDILDYNFTANVEEEFDVVAEGKLEWQKMLANFYGPFHTQVVKTTGEAQRESGERDLGIDPVSGKKVIARIGRFGPMIQIGHQDDEEKPRFASVPSGKSISTITFDEAMELFALPRKVGTYKDQEISAAIGRFGPYIKRGTTFISIPRGSEFDVFSITLDQAVVLVDAKIEQLNNRNISAFDYEGKKIEVLRGQYGPFIKFNGSNFKIPKSGKDATDLTLEDCITIIGPKALATEADKPKKKAAKTKTKKTTKKREK